MIDIDFFKKVNDKYGHFVGDEVLKMLTKNINDNIRNSDILARMGGEEFVVLLNETNEEEALEIAQKIRKIIENSNLEYNDINVQVTISIGLSMLNHEKDNEIDEILIRADEALYISKNSGRNKVSIKNI